MLFVKLFRIELWILSAFTFLILGWLCYFSMENFSASFGIALFRSWEIFCRQDTAVPSKLFGKIILFVMLMISLILNTAYSANLTSLLAVKKVHFPFYDLPSLFYATNYEIGTVSGTWVDSEFSEVNKLNGCNYVKVITLTFPCHFKEPRWSKESFVRRQIFQDSQFSRGH